MSRTLALVDPTHVGMSQLEHSLTYAMGSHMQNNNVPNKNADDLMDGPSFQRLAM